MQVPSALDLAAIALRDYLKQSDYLELYRRFVEDGKGFLVYPGLRQVLPVLGFPEVSEWGDTRIERVLMRALTVRD